MLALIAVRAFEYADRLEGQRPAIVAFPRSGGDARSIPRIRIPGEHTRDRSVLVGKLAEILN